MIELLTPAAESPLSYVNAIEANGLSKRYGRRWALLNAGFVLPRASTLLLAGHNGSGKSTLMRVLATATRADRGSATVAGHSLRDHSAVRPHVALLGHASFLYETLTAEENLSIAANLLGRDRAEVMLLLDRVGLKQRAKDLVSSFSAGMRKRLSLARVLLQRADVLLLDEPYGALDPAGFALMDEVVKEAKQRGATVILSTHQLERGVSLCDFALLLEQGEIEWSGNAADLLAAVGKRRFEFAEVGAW
jgi:heme exporter protein A